MKNWKGALIGGIVGLLVGIFFSVIDIGTTLCVKNYNLSNFLCSVSGTYNEFGVIAAIVSTPKLFFKNLLSLDGMSEVMVSPLVIISGFFLGALLGYLIKILMRRNEKQNFF